MRAREDITESINNRVLSLLAVSGPHGLPLSPPLPLPFLRSHYGRQGRRRRPHSRSLSPINSADADGVCIPCLPLRNGNGESARRRRTDHHSAAARHASHTMAPYPGFKSKEKFGSYSGDSFFEIISYCLRGFYGFSTSAIPQKC